MQKNDWHTGLLTIPAKGEMVGSAVESDLTTWPDYNGEVPKLMEGATSEMLQVVLFHKQKWDSAKDGEVPDLSKL